MSKPNIPETWWCNEALKLLDHTADVIDGWTSDAARQGRYEDASSLAFIAQAFRTWIDERLDDDFDAACERAWDRQSEERLADGRIV